MRQLTTLFALTLIPLILSCNPDPRTMLPAGSDQHIAVALHEDLQTLDPRIVRSTYSVTIEHLMFEGLMRKNYVGKVVPAIAEEVEISDDGLVYTFKLREASWSNGAPVTAADFEYAWKSMLNPAFPAPNAYQLYVIKGAREAKNGKLSVDDVGIHAINDKTLEVTLQEPIPYFLELTTAHFFAPINPLMDTDENHRQSAPIVNGPFQLSEWKKGNEISFVKNPHYWDSPNVRLDKITFVIADETAALQMFQRRELDWVGSPLSMIPPDAVQTLKAQRKLVITPADGTHWFRINVEKPPLDNRNMRKALAYAIDRQSIVDHITQANQVSATGIVPTHYGLQTRPYFEDRNVTVAWSHFQEGLKEMQISKDDLPKISLCYMNNERNRKIAQAVQQQWKKVLDIDVALETCESSVFFEKLNHQDFQISFGSWFGDISDPVNFLEVFKFKESKTNNTQWESKDYIALLDASSDINDRSDRYELLSQAERILIDEMPVIPLYHATFNHMNHNIVGVYFSPLGYLDFTYAFKKPLQ